ncbi:MAG: DUF309 domain-containing protein [Chloroflexi bacterium]|uniref:DUF309 domain-containing protein n=1 Tax=Candidatus Chlorohelix allophototropha TaxID=3003348 RepID=A0A8T7M5X5_9CHLR|nr:DUF309 domain-containing protein [Chloroflexota bacterium]WJW69381.1 DUF309 domain-containing protein [Chloroflexota bacterium L227-S17]
MERELPPPDFFKGVAEFNAREFFECHETLEKIWLEEPGEIRKLYQGILQIGVGFYHCLTRQNYRGAVTLLQNGIDKCRPFAPQQFGLNLEALIKETELALSRIKELGTEHIANFDSSLIPTLNEISQIG